jgi:hypothetical protein
MEFLRHPEYDRLLMGSPLRRRGVCTVIGAALFVVLARIFHEVGSAQPCKAA